MKKQHEFGVAFLSTGCRICFLLLWLWGIMTILAGVEARAQQDGFILEITGPWVLEGHPGNRLKLGDKVSLGKTITIDAEEVAKNGGKCAILIVLPNGEHLSRRGTPENPVTPVRVVQLQGVKIKAWARITREVREIFGPEKVRLVPGITRDPEDGKVSNLKEAVVGFNNGKLDLLPAFAGLPPGKYEFQVRQQQLAGLGREPVVKRDQRKFELQWDPSVPEKARAEMVALPPGLYNLAMLNAGGQAVEPQVWILVVAPTDFAIRSAEFNEAEKLTASWGADAGPVPVRSFLRAYLKILSLPERK